MKLMVDISEEDYKECKFRKDLLSLGGEPTDLTFNMRMETLIANGTPLEEGLEKIKAEVEEIRTKEPLMSRGFECYGFKDKTAEDFKTEVIKLLKKYISELKGENK